MFTFRRAQAAAYATLLAALLGGCAPGPEQHASDAEPLTNGRYLAVGNKLFDPESEFDIRWEVTYPEREKGFSPALNVSDRQLAMNRCTWCHECGFKRAFDYDHYQTLDWHPLYVGDAWANPVQRMTKLEAAMLNEHVAARIYTFLRDETTGRYDESADDKGATIIDVPQGFTPPGVQPTV